MKLYLIAVFSLMNITAISQDFEGAITYKTTFDSHNPNLSVAQLEAAIGKKMIYYYKNGEYKSVINSQSMEYQMYDKSSNRLIHKTPAVDTLYYLDAAINPDSAVSIAIKPNADTVMGKVCDVITLHTSMGSTILSYSKDYPISKALFSKHKYGNWALIMEKTGALPLKLVIETPNFTMISTAVEITPQRLDDKLFDPPAGALFSKLPQ